MGSIIERIHPIQQLGGPTRESGIQICCLHAVEPILTFADQLNRAWGGKEVKASIATNVDNIFKAEGLEPVDLPEGREGVVILIGPNPAND